MLSCNVLGVQGRSTPKAASITICSHAARRLHDVLVSQRHYMFRSSSVGASGLHRSVAPSQAHHEVFIYKAAQWPSSDEGSMT